MQYQLGHLPVFYREFHLRFDHLQIEFRVGFGKQFKLSLAGN